MAGRADVNLLLDTSTFLWMCAGGENLSTAARKALRDARATVHVSALTAWEIAIKAAKGKLALPAEPQHWFPAMLAHHRLIEISLQSTEAMASTRLPPIHADPFDRWLIATAKERKLVLVTSDETIRRYPGLKTVW